MANNAAEPAKTVKWNEEKAAEKGTILRLRKVK